jgi:DNA-binding MarR family transcriptional regulator
MYLKSLDEALENLMLIGKRKRIIKELYPNEILQQSELAEKTSIAKGNLSKYINELKEKELVKIESKINERGLPVKMISLSRIPINILKATEKIVSSEKPLFEDSETLNIFCEGLFVSELQEYSKNSIQLISNQFIVPVKSGFFTFLKENLLDSRLAKARRVLIISTRNMVSYMTTIEKKEVLEILKPVLHKLLEDSSKGLEKETRELLKELGVYDLPYEKLEELYFTEIKQGKVPEFFRVLILQNHHEKVPKLRARLMGFHLKSSNSIRSIIHNELPLIR